MSVVKNNGPIIDPALCRCCRAIKKCRILTAEYTWMGQKEVYADMVMDCYGILLSHVDEVERDSGVCATCVVRLREAVAFRQQVLQCEELFLRAKLEPPAEEPDENKLKKFDLELKTEPKDYSSDHNSGTDDRDDACPVYSDDDDNKPLKNEEPKPEQPQKDDELKNEGSDFRGDSSSDSDEPIKKKVKRKAKAKANGAKKKPGKAVKKQKAESDNTETDAPDTGTFATFDVPLEFQTRAEIEVELIEDELMGNDGIDSIPETVKRKKPWGNRPENVTTEYSLLCERLDSDEQLYFAHYNMSKGSFEELYNMLESSIEKEYTNYRKPIPSRERLAVCLRYLRTGESFNAIAKSHSLGRTTVSKIVYEVSKSIWEVLQPVYVPTPTGNTWTLSEVGFWERFRIPNCVGSVGAKHVLVKGPALKDRRDFHAEVCQSSVVLVAVADAYCNITVADVGSYRTNKDNEDLFESTSFYRDFVADDRILPPKPLPGDDKPVNHVWLGDESFTMRASVMRPFPKFTALKDPMQRVFNERLNAARTVDRVFGILLGEWRIFQKPIECLQESVIYLTRAACCLHNYIRSKHGIPGHVEELVQIRAKQRRKSLKALFPFKPLNHRSTNTAIFTRQAFMAFFNRVDGGPAAKTHAIVYVEPGADEITIKEEPIL